MVKYVRTHLIVAGLYSLLALILTWPLAARLTTHIPGEATWAFDESTFIWNMWWLKYSLLNLGQSPLESTHTFFPLGVSLTTYTFNLFNAAFGLPLQLAFTLPEANNLVLLFSYVSSAYGAFLLSLYLLSRSKVAIPVSTLAAFAAGAVFAFSASRMMYVALGHYNFVTIQWFPFYTLFLLKALRVGTYKQIFLAALFAALCLYAELTYSVFLLFLTLIIVFDEWLRASRTGSSSDLSAQHSTMPVQLLRLVAIGLITLILTAPFVLSVLPDFMDPAYSRPGWGEGLKLSADLIGLVTITPLHPLSDLDWITELRDVVQGTSRFSDANTLFLGYGILALALIGWVAYRKVARVWLWSIILFTILSLGPLLTINGQNRFNLDGIDVTFPLPFALLHYIPILSANRVPNRFGIPLTLALAVLVGYGAAWLLTKLSGVRFGDLSRQTKPARPAHSILALLISLTLIVAVLLFDQLSVPIPLTNARIPEAYYHIGAEEDAFTIMQLPLGWRNSYGTLGAERTQLQYYQAAHQRPMLGGNTSRNPEFKFDYYANIPLFAAITQAELYRPVDSLLLDRAQQQAADLMTLYNIKYLAIHQPIPFRKPYEDTHQATSELALALIPHQADPVYKTDDVQVFAVQQAEIADPFVVDFGHWPGAPYRGPGWAGDEEVFAATANWATAGEAIIFFPNRNGGDRRLSIDIAPFSYPDMPQQVMAPALNGHPLDQTFLLHEGWQSIDLLLPEPHLVSGLNRVQLQFANTAQPRQVLPARRTIGQTGLETPVDLEVNSGNDFAFITVDFGDAAVDASAHRRGVNVAVVDPQSGRLVSSQGFDTAANEFEAAALAQFVTGLPAGRIVILSTQGLDAAAHFSPATDAALLSLGIAPDGLTPPFSAIGVKGTPPGTALLAQGEGAAYLRLGASPDTRDLAAAVDKITITSSPAAEESLP